MSFMRAGGNMHSSLLELKDRYEHIGDVYKSTIVILTDYNKDVVLKHSLEVSDEAKKLAEMFGENVEAAGIAGILHDISAIIPNSQRIEVAESLGLYIYQEERDFPLIIHQRLSKEIANKVLKITDIAILEAISCHTTLRENPTRLDLILFIADKIKWDQAGKPPYLKTIEDGLHKSLKEGVFNFLKYLFDNQEMLKVVHPWLVEAYECLDIR